LLLQREINEEINIFAAKKAQENKIIVTLDVGGQDTEISKELIKNTNIISPNETELIRLLGKETILESESDFINACLEIRKKYDNSSLEFLIKLGAKGAMFITKDNIIYKQNAFSIKSMPIVDTTGAGDCFTGSFSGKYLETLLLNGKPNIEESLEFGTAAAYKSITSFGASNSMPTLDELKKVLELAKEVNN